MLKVMVVVGIPPFTIAIGGTGGCLLTLVAACVLPLCDA